MDFKPNPNFEQDMGEELQRVVQEAIDSTARSYDGDSQIDPAALLRDELASRGIEGTDDAWIGEVADHIRSGRPIIVGHHDGSVDDER